MSNLSNAKTFGGIGSLLMLVGIFIPAVGTLINIIGLVLVFIAVKYIADELKDHDIFKNYLMYFIMNIIAIVAATAIIIFTIGTMGGLSFFTTISEMGGFSDFASFWSYFETFIVGCALALLIGWILLILATLYLRKSFNSIAKHTKVDLFKTTGLVFFIGAITLIIAIGALIMIIALILQIVAFFSIPDKPPKEIESTEETPKSERRCPHCNRIIPEDAKTCPYCSKKLEK